MSGAEKTERLRYLNGEITHQEYYQAIAEEVGLSYKYNAELIAWGKSALENGDAHFNGKRLPFWDRLGIWARNNPRVHQAFKKRGDSVSYAGIVCLVKAALRRDCQ